MRGRRSLLSHTWERTSAAMSNMLRCELPAETALRSCLLKWEPERRLKEQQTKRQRGNSAGETGARQAAGTHRYPGRNEGGAKKPDTRANSVAVCAVRWAW